MTNENDRTNPERTNPERTNPERSAEMEAARIAPEKETMKGDLSNAVGEILNDDGRMDTEYTEADYDRAHPDKA